MFQVVLGAYKKILTLIYVFVEYAGCIPMDTLLPTMGGVGI